MSTNGALSVRRAAPHELGEVVAILSECARRLLVRGIRQWPLSPGWERR